MAHTCVCTESGTCSFFKREMSDTDFDICRNCFNNQSRASIVSQWYKERGRKLGILNGCALKGDPVLNEFGNQKIRRTCGCGGQKAEIPLFECHHPQPRTAEEDCEKRCSDYTSF